MKSKKKNCDKLKLIKSLLILNMLEQPNCIIIINKKSKKNSTHVNNKNKTPNILSKEKNWKDKKNAKYILPISQVNIEGHSEFIPPVSDKSNMSNFIIFLKILHWSYCNQNINKSFKNNSTNINFENLIYPNNLTVKNNTKDKLNTKYILPMPEVISEDDIKCINKQSEINTTVNNICKIPKITNTNHSETLISTLPIIIGEKNIDIPIESTFRLKSAALDIKNIKKDVYLTNSKLLPLYEKDGVSSLNGKFFLEGFIRNKLDFSIVKGVHDGIINLDTECVIIYVPFKCTTLIQYKIPPVFSKEKVVDYIPLYISSDCLDIKNDFNEYLSEKKTRCSEYINCDISPINCEINQSKIYETYTLIDKKPFNKDFPAEIDFHTIKENIIINLSLTLIQNQDIAINYRKNSK